MHIFSHDEKENSKALGGEEFGSDAEGSRKEQRSLPTASHSAGIRPCQDSANICAHLLHDMRAAVQGLGTLLALLCFPEFAEHVQ